MIVAIYARKSKLTDSGDSIENQINMCKDYITKFSNFDHTPIEFVVYKDEGFSGGNANRPGFQQMLEDAKNNAFSKLVCYRLDRVSRSVADFANTYDILHQHHVEFISIREQFDTSTPIGRAMLNIAVVFAQLERETIAERIRDNMLDLAKTGRWLGGVTPTGYSSSPIEYLDQNMNRKKLYKLIPEPDELQVVSLIYEKFLEIKSLRGLETYLVQHDVLSKTGKKYSPSTLKDILQNPVYACNDLSLYDYLSTLGCMLCDPREAYDGTKSVISYNKNKKVTKDIVRQDKVLKTQQMVLNTPDKWIIAIAEHKPLISGQQWVYVQSLLEASSKRSFYTGRVEKIGMLSNLIRCEHCGSLMRLKKGRVSTVTGLQAYVYLCYTKEISQCQKCNIPNINGRMLDEDVIGYLTELASPTSPVMADLTDEILSHTKDHDTLNDKLKALEDESTSIQAAISRVMQHFTKFDPSDATMHQHFMNELDTLSKQQENIKSQMHEAKSHFITTQNKLYELNIIKDALKSFPYLIQTEDVEAQRNCMRSIIDRILWDGQTIKLFICDQMILSHHLQTFCSGRKCYTNS